jgi:Domain of unknown function (DUF4279)
MREEVDPDQEPPFFYFEATLRIFGVIDDFDAISETLCLTPTRSHRRGERLGPSRTQEFDMWMYTAPVPRDRPLDVHIQTLWAHIKSHRDYLVGLKARLSVDVYCSYQTNAVYAGFEVSHKSLEMFIQLEVPFGVSMEV